LQVADLERSLGFYEELLGFKRALETGHPPRLAETVALSATGKAPYQLLLTERAQARPKPPRTTGLYHLAIRYPDRRALARAFARLATDPALAPVAQAISRFTPLTGDGDRAETELARWCPAAVKGGAQGCVGVAWIGGLGVAAKCWTGESAPAAAAAAIALRRLGILSDHGWEMLAGVVRPVVTGGGRPVGHLEVLEDGP